MIKSPGSRIIAHCRKQLLDLLCIIHHDSGQYVDTYGMDKAVEDAKRLVTDAIQDKPDNSCL